MNVNKLFTFLTLTRMPTSPLIGRSLCIMYFVVYKRVMDKVAGSKSILLKCVERYDNYSCHYGVRILKKKLRTYNKEINPHTLSLVTNLIWRRLS